MATGGALALNQYFERDFDARMKRTQHPAHPLGAARSPPAALVFGTALMMAGFAYLGFLVGALPAVIAALSATAYHFVYTPLKTRSHIATLAGGVPGAVPTLIGWSAARGTLDLGGLGALRHRLRCGSSPTCWPGLDAPRGLSARRIPPDPAARRARARHQPPHAGLAPSLVPLSGVPTWLGYTGWVYLGGPLAASLAFLALGLKARHDFTDRAARTVFFGSLIYHPVLLVLMLFDTVHGRDAPPPSITIGGRSACASPCSVPPCCSPAPSRP